MSVDEAALAAAHEDVTVQLVEWQKAESGKHEMVRLPFTIDIKRIVSVYLIASSNTRPTRQAAGDVVREALETYANKDMWLGEDRSGPVTPGKWHVHPITYVWRGFQGDTEADHPADLAREALSALAPRPMSETRAVKEMEADAARYRYLREHRSWRYGMTQDEPMECGISFEFVQRSPAEARFSIDDAIDADIAAFPKPPSESEAP